MKWTKQLHRENAPFYKHSFLCSEKNFLKFLKGGSPFISGAIKYLSVNSLKYSKEMIYQNHEFLKKYKDSKILIIGAGPSNQLNFDPNQYDYIWSCNHFFRNEKVKSLNIDFVTLGNENDLFDNDLNEYLSTHETIICFENKYTKTEEMATIKKMYPNRVFWALTRYHSRIGSIPRLICIASELGVKEIDVIGMDGFVNSKLRKEHKPGTFEPNKKPTGTISSTFNDEEEIMKNYEEQYLAFWDYILHDLSPNISYRNLGHNHPCNITTRILKEKLGENYQEYLISPRPTR